MKNILFRADSSSNIGTGHIMRDLVLASQYKNSNIIFATQNLDGNINKKILDAGYKIEILKSNDIKEVKKLIKKYDIDLLVIDSYKIDYKYEKGIKEKYSKIKILSFDDTYEKHHCDILLNHNIGADERKYIGLVPFTCELRCGTKFTLLRDEFKKQKQKNTKNTSKEKTVFLAMGGADHSNINIDILKVIKKFKNINVNLVTTTANKNIEQLKKYVANKDWIDLHINTNKIAKLMRQSDFAIVTPSVILNEVYFMELPFIAIKTADNQKDVYRYLKLNSFVTMSKFKSDKLESKITRLIKSIL